jgi:putative flippase GtrA
MDLGTYALFLSLDQSADLAKGIGYVAGMIVGFVLNKAWTFRSRDAASGEIATYVLLYAITLVINIGLNRVMTGALAGLLPRQTAIAGAFLVATGTTTVLNFLGMRFITFRRGIAAGRKTPSQMR